MSDESRANFGSKIGAILAAAGSAVGLGNIWRFPYQTGNDGGDDSRVYHRPSFSF